MRFLLIFLLLATAHGANLVPNSSFELPGRWLYSGETVDDRIGNLNALASNFIPDAPFHGNMCWSNYYGAIYSRAIWLTGSTVRVSTYLKAQAGSGSCAIGLVSFDNPEATATATQLVTSSWARYSTNQVVPSNGFYYVKVANWMASSLILQTNLYIDAVQVEYGSSLTAYAPMNTVEIGLATSDLDNHLFQDDAKQFQLRFWNESSTVTVPPIYQIRDLWNRKMSAATNYVSVPAGSSTNTYNLPPGTNGYLRVTARLADRDNSWDEIGVNVFPFVTNTPATWQMRHAHSSPYHVRRDARLGFYSSRLMSPANVRWYTADLIHGNDVEHTEGAMTNESSWAKADVQIDTLYTNGLKVFLNLHSGSGGTSYPPWATNKTRAAFIAAWNEYVNQVTRRYTNKLWGLELWNEPYSPGAIASVNPFSLYEYTNYAQMMEPAIHTIRSNCPTAIIVFGCFEYTAPQWTAAAFTNLTASAQGKVDVLSMHGYPTDDSDASPTDPNERKYDSSMKENSDVLGAIKPWWNTESGILDSGGIKGLNAMFQGNYNVQGQFASEPARDKANHRTPLSVDRHMNHVIRYMGMGCQAYGYYDGRRYSMAEFFGGTFSGLEMHGPEKACSVAFLISRNFLGVGLGQSTNIHVPYNFFEIYKFTNGGNAVLGLINTDRTNRTFGCTNGAFAVHDMMGNQIQTNSTNVTFSRTPVYVVSGTLNITQLSETLRYATCTSNADVNPPAISIDIAPSGLFDADNPMTLVKWTGIDRERVVTVAYTNSVLYAWKLDGGSYTAYSQSNHFWHPFTAGNHTITVRAQDESGNTAEEPYQFAVGAPVKSGITGGVSIFGKVDQR